jgi:hypothetical protein
MEMELHTTQGHLQPQLAMALITILILLVTSTTTIITDLHHHKPAGSMETLIRSSTLV